MIPSSRNNLNTGNPFVHIPKQLPESDSDNNFLPQPNALTKIRLYPENKIWIWIILLSWVNKQLWILIPSLNIPHRHKHSNNLFISQGSIQILSGGQKLICLGCLNFGLLTVRTSWFCSTCCWRNIREIFWMTTKFQHHYILLINFQVLGGY